ncbi:MAG TPA: hypothetical protein VEV16_05680, partial [Daejeonella sp.]|nr:hypothetical protein [Daejeonella sp.]
MQKGLIFILLLSIAFYGFAQTISFSGDLKNASYLQVNQTYQFPQSPQGYGHIKEFKPNPKRSPFLFKEERNSTWFLIDIPFDGLFTFEISPSNIRDDYDWMLFLYSPGLEKAILNDTAWPLRSNNARNNKALFSKTGLSAEGKKFHEKPGVGNNYSLPIEPKAGDKLALIIDNIYDGGGGFDLMLNLKAKPGEKLVLLRGNI